MKTRYLLFAFLFAALPKATFAQNLFVGHLMYNMVTDYDDDSVDSTMAKMGQMSAMTMNTASNGQTVAVYTVSFGGISGKKFKIGQPVDTTFSSSLDFPAYQRCIEAKTKNYTDVNLDSLKLAQIMERCRAENTEWEQAPATYEPDSRDRDVQYFQEYRDIIGYHCQKAIVTDETGAKTTVFFTSSLPPVASRDKGWQRLRGLVLYREQAMFGFKVQMEATMIDFKRPTEADFFIPGSKD